MSYEEWKVIASNEPLDEDYLKMLWEQTQKHGPANCWAVEPCATIRRLLIEINRLKRIENESLCRLPR